MRAVIDDSGLQRWAGESRTRLPAARKALLRILATRLEGHALDLSKGGSAPGDYPIPVVTGKFRGAFGIRVSDRSATVFNDSNYAQAIHDGYQPYGNPHARPIPPRPFFTDAFERLDLDEAHRTWEQQFINTNGFTTKAPRR